MPNHAELLLTKAQQTICSDGKSSECMTLKLMNYSKHKLTRVKQSLI